jgi:asparagine synthase (glutamine-hydrolysing)
MTRVFGIGLTRFLPFLLDRVDRMGAAAGLRTHLPFLDHRFVEEVWDLDYNLKCAQGIEKDLLRKAFTGWLPPEIIHRRKSGFAVVKNPAYTGEVVGYLGELLARRSEEPLFQIVDPDRLSAVLAGTGWADGTFSAPPILPRLVMLDLWMKEYSVRFDPIGPFSA